jgi:LysM repeat protein
MTVRRLFALSVVAAGVPFFLAACGDSGGSSSETTAGPSTSLWRTIPPVLDTGAGGVLVPEGGSITYIVKSGDYANKIAAKAAGGCSGNELLEYNPELQDNLYPGAAMKIPASCLGTGVTEETLNASADTTTNTTDAADDTTDTTDVPKYNSYTVVKGDYEFGIVKKTGCSSAALRKANPGKMSNLKPKMKLKIPTSCDTRDPDAETDDSST